jgi:hypothetical protein
MYALVGMAVVLWQQVGAQLYKHRGLTQRLGPDILLNMERVQVDGTGEGRMH